MSRNVVRYLGGKETTIITGDFIALVAGDINGHIGSNPENYENQHEHYGYGVRNKERKRILICAAMNVTLGDTPFKNKANHQASFESC